MLRIRTKIGDGRVFTLFFMGKWVTLMNDGKKASSTDATNLADAGLNHMAFCQKLKGIVDARGKHSTELLHGDGCQGNDSRGTPGSDDESHREGTHGDGGSERHENLSANSPPEEGQDSPQLGPQDTELDNGQQGV